MHDGPATPVRKITDRDCSGRAAQDVHHDRDRGAIAAEAALATRWSAMRCRTPWRRLYSVRNASDPQLPDPSGNIEAAKQQAGRIYSEWGVFTTAANCHCSVKCHPESRSSVVICQMTSELAKADSA
jgi:hypothetical protein